MTVHEMSDSQMSEVVGGANWYQPTGGNPQSTTAPDGYSNWQAHTIQTGETLSHYAAKFHVTIAFLQEVNHIPNANLIYAGQTIWLPGAY